MENFIEKYYVLGNVMYKYYNGEILSLEELELIARASDSDKVTAMELNAQKRLSLRNDNSHSNFCKNANTLKIVRNEKPKVK